jgi:hypothetical protein
MMHSATCSKNTWATFAVRRNSVAREGVREIPLQEDGDYLLQPSSALNGEVSK